MLKFAADGWRGTISREVTFENIEKLTAGLAVYLIGRDLIKLPLIVSYDSRFLSEHFAAAAVKKLAEAGAYCLLTERDVPLPIIAWEIRDRGAGGAIYIGTDSSFPTQSGLRFIPGAGGPLTEADMLAVSQSGMGRINQLNKAKSRIERFEPRDRYFQYLAGSVNAGAIKEARPKVVIDPMYGAARGYADQFLQRLGCRTEEIHNYRDVLFNGSVPDLLEENLSELKAQMAESGAPLGLAFNSVGDRCAGIDKRGKYFLGQAEQDAILAAVRFIESQAGK
ncbi:MAG TPA: hypothetical protein VMT55_05315 [Candidatus Sulfotelmatobacter sp.]|nr:hypothetical protein [Candidatus Sulfotelmatobacter sp.]